MNAEENTAQTSPTLATQPFSVKKRNGQHVPFFEARILRAIEAAWKSSLRMPQEVVLPEDAAAQAAHVTTLVVDWCKTQAARTTVIFIEDIQDSVIRILAQEGHGDVSERYTAYRRSHAERRLDAARLTVEKRDGRVVSFKPEKIALAIGKAAFSNGELAMPDQRLVLDLTERVVAEARGRGIAGVLHIEEIQDLVEKTLMAAGRHDEARRYILYREDRRRTREAEQPERRSDNPTIRLKTPTGERTLDVATLRLELAEFAQGLEDEVSLDRLAEMTRRNCYDLMPEERMLEASLMAARALIEVHPDYSFVAARMLLKRLYSEVLGENVALSAMTAKYAATFEGSIRELVRTEHLDPRLLDFDLKALGAAIVPERDKQFQFMGLQTLYDRYFIHHEDRRLELPQAFWMRVAMGLALKEANKNDRAVEFYSIMSRLRFVPSTPTLFNAGTPHPQLSSCFLTTVPDDLDGIFKCIKDNAMLSKWSGGLGNDWTPVRSMGARIKGTNGASQGVVPFLKVANDTAVAVNQGGKRQGAVCAYLEVWHMDIEEFLELRKNTGDDRRRTHDMHTANWIPDLFMQRVLADGPWTLFSPNETPDLHDLTGKAFARRYAEYEAKAAKGEMRKFKTLSAVQLWRKMLGMLFETGHPWITFKDPSNIRSPQDHAGVVHSSNLCTEILLNTSEDETAVCNLGSINLIAHVTEAGLDKARLAETVTTAVRMLDNVIDLNFYPTREAGNSNLRHRPVGLGVMGFQDALYAQGLSFASAEAVRFADISQEAVAHAAIWASSRLAAERGAYESYAGSKWERGMLPLDTIDLLANERGGHLDMDRSSTMDWNLVRASIKEHGMRNSNVMAIAPTATIGNIVGVTQSIEPTYKNLFVKSNLSGEFTTPNPWLVRELKAVGLWDQRMLDDLKYFDGSLQEMPRVPRHIKDRFVTAFELAPEWLIECASRRQKWIDMGQSLNLYLAQASGKKMHSMYLMAWEKGLKTTYYLRSLGATRVEKSTSDVNRYGDALGRNKPVDAKACSIEKGPDCEACQ